MKFNNINTDYLKTHRYGWINIIKNLHENCTDSDILLIDYMDKYFNKWLEEPKVILCDNVEYNFTNGDAHYYIRDKTRQDVFIHIDECNNNIFIKWYPNYNEFKILRGVLNKEIIPKYNNIVSNDKWVGFLHYPIFSKESPFSSGEEFINIIESNKFKLMAPNCKFIVTLSNYLNNQCKKILIDNGYNIPVHTIYHPTDVNCNKFNITKYINNKEKSLIQIGSWLRKIDCIFNVNTNLLKKWLPGTNDWKCILEKFNSNILDFSNVEILNNLSNDEYDELLTKNIVLMYVYTSSANNTIIECIARNTPIIVNKHAAIVEYLGENYPLYFNNSNDLQKLLTSSNFNGKILHAHQYLQRMDKNFITIDFFVSKFRNILNTDNLLF